MRITFFLLVLIFTSLISKGQNESDKILYVVDSIPIFEEPEEGFSVLEENDIDNIVVIKAKDKIDSLGYPTDLDGIIYIFTKEFHIRPDSIKIIPTTKAMERINGKWHLKHENLPYSGRFIDYYLNGKKQGEGMLVEGELKGLRIIYHLNGTISDEIMYEKGISNGMEKRYYDSGVLMQKGEFKNGLEIGIWEMYYPNGQLKQRTPFDNGKMNGESVTYYSTGKIKVRQVFKNDVSEKNKTLDKIYNLYSEGIEFDKMGDFESSIKRYSKCIELDSTFVDAYFARGTAKLNNLQFSDALTDFNKTLEIEPYFTKAFGNRAFTIIRKYEFGDIRTLSKSNGVQVMASKEKEIPQVELEKICKDLNKAVSLGDNNWMILDALKKYCQ
jgi:antitoxin component YwqK of YwqJK toxin-antitoxin module